MAETKGKDKSRTIKKWDEHYIGNEELLKPIIDYVRNDENECFLTFRDGKITIYYKKLVAVSLKPIYTNKWSIQRRSESTSKDSKYVEISRKYLNNVERYGFGKNVFSKRMSIESSGAYADLLVCAKSFVDDFNSLYHKDIKTELSIQGEIACNYQNIRNGLLCVDVEFAQPHKNQKEKELSDIKGRYDFIFLKKDSGTDKYKLVFVELKSKTDAFTGSSGIVKHYDDIKDYIKKFKEDENGIKTLMKAGVKFAIKTKKALGLITSDIDEENDINFDDPEFWFLFKMADEEDITTKEQILKLISKDIKSKSEDEINDILNNSYYDDSDGFVRIK